MTVMFQANFQPSPEAHDRAAIFEERAVGKVDSKPQSESPTAGSKADEDVPHAGVGGSLQNGEKHA